MPKYFYNCPSCNKEYIEIRLAIDPQWYSECSDCNVEFNFVKEEPNS